MGKTRINAMLFILLLLSSQASGQGWSPENGLILQGDLVTMNETMEVIPNGRLVVVGEKIAAVLQAGEELPENLDLSGAVTVQTNGWIFPGLIDAHNHVSYNVLPLYEVPQTYDNRYQWTGPASYKQHVNYPKTLLTSRSYYNLHAEVVKYGEVKAIVGGVTSIQGSPNLTATRLLVRNIEHKNFDQDRIYQRGLAITDTRWQPTVEDGLLRLMQEDKVDAWLVHLAEGTDDSSRQEMTVLRDLGLVGDLTVAIHGTAFSRDHFREMAEKGTKLVWSPLSNLLLYGETTKIPEALDEGVLVSLGTDWSPSGSKNLLGELKIADQVDQSRFGDVISDQELVRMVTINPALALGLDDKVGQLKAGLYGDIAVYAKIQSDPYRSLIESNEQHVRLVLVGGEPLYGDRTVMEAVKPGDFEVLVAGSVEKAIDVTDPNLSKGAQTLGEISQMLEEALLFDREHIWESFGDSRTEEEFDAFIESKFSRGLVPKRLDPIFAFDDPDFFEAINSSTIASLGFDVSTFWESADGPDPDVLMLTFVNSPDTTLEVLDVDVGLDSRAALNIVSHRNGTDGRYGTSDDNLFDDLPELDLIPYVGRSALEKLRDFSGAHVAIEAAQEERDEIYMLLAYGVVLKDWQTGGPDQRGHNVGSVLVDGDGKIVYWARNSNHITKNGTQHGEVRLILGYLSDFQTYNLPGYTVYTTLEPCVQCSGMMKMVSMKRVVYGQSDPGFGKALERLSLDTHELPNLLPNQ